MSDSSEIKAQLSLALDESARLRRQLERDSASGKLAELAKKSLSDHKSGKSTEL